MILVKLILAHLLGDFFLQPHSWVKDKETLKIKSSKLYLHVLIHMLLLALLLGDFSLWPLILIIGISHYLIDLSKLYLQKPHNQRYYFFVDQLLHLIIIGAVYLWWFLPSFVWFHWLTNEFLLLLTPLLFLTVPVSIIMKTIFSKWNIESLTGENSSLKDAGNYIGILERVLVFIFIIMDHWEAVGFLITAKSVFRFGDLQEAKQRKLTEYVLIGTLISFGIAIITGLLYILFLKGAA